MLGWSLAFLVVALICGAFAFGGIAGTSMLIAEILFCLSLFLFIGTLILRTVRT